MNKNDFSMASRATHIPIPIRIGVTTSNNRATPLSPQLTALFLSNRRVKPGYSTTGRGNVGGNKLAVHICRFLQSPETSSTNISRNTATSIRFTDILLELGDHRRLPVVPTKRGCVTSSRVLHLFLQYLAMKFLSSLLERLFPGEPGDTEALIPPVARVMEIMARGGLVISK